MNKISPLSEKSIAVFGANGAWGSQIIASLENNSQRIFAIEKDTEPHERDIMLDESDVIFLATPASEIRGILKAVRSRLDGKIVMDCATSKDKFSDLLVEIGEETSVCSTHPMVKPGTSPRGQNALIMPVGSHAEAAMSIARGIFSLLEMKVCELDFEQHRKMMTIVQMTPHLIQRVVIAALGRVLETTGMTMDDVQKIAPANFRMTELAFGRVGIQKPEVSAEIIADALSAEFGQTILRLVQQECADIAEQGPNVDSLVSKFNSDVHRLDPRNDWRNHILERTDVVIERLGNLSMQSLVLTSDRDEPGVLLRICEVLNRYNINMTAVDSHRTQSGEHPHVVRFDVGISDCEIDWEAVQRELEQCGLQFRALQK